MPPPRAPPREVVRLLGDLARLLERVWEQGGRRLPGGVAPHRIRFSARMTTSWAIIYYRRREVRLSPYVFLLALDELPRGSDFRELEATVLHEVAHAHLWAETRDAGHPPEFAHRLARLGIRPNGAADLGPENAAFRYRYSCPTCERAYLRRVPLGRRVSCGRCGPGGYDPRHQLRLAETLPPPWARLQKAVPRLRRALREGRARYPETSVIAPRSRKGPRSAR